MTLIDVESGEIVHTLGRRADLTALDGQGDVGAIIVRFHDPLGLLRLLDGTAAGGRIAEYTPPA